MADQDQNERSVEKVILVSVLTNLVRGIQRNVFPENGISNDVLNRFMSLLCTDSYKGVYNIFDELPIEVVNEDNATMVINIGRHFVLVHVTPENVTYFDPIGDTPPFTNSQRKYTLGGKELKTYLHKVATRGGRKMCRELLIWNRPIQASSSNYCGLYCMLVALHWNRNLIKPVLKFPKRATLKNDKLCILYLIDSIKNM
jgi:hypothetical protein